MEDSFESGYIDISRDELAMSYGDDNIQNNKVVVNFVTYEPIVIGEEVTVSVDVGKGHEELIKKYIDSIEDENQKAALSLDGNVLTYKAYAMPDENNHDTFVALGAYYLLYAVLSEFNQSTIDNDEEFMFVYDKANASSYDDFIELMEKGIEVKDSMKFYAIWAKYNVDKIEKEWTAGSKGKLDFVFSRDIIDKGYSLEDQNIFSSTFKCFKEAYLDGEPVNATVSEGSLKLSLGDEVLNELSLGKHDLTVEFYSVMKERMDEAAQIDDVSEFDTSKTISISSTINVVSPRSVTPTYRIPTTGIE